jgi:hypothetical protein
MRLHIVRVAAFAICVVALGVCGCEIDNGTGDATTPEPPPIDACALLTPEDAQAVLGIGAGRMTSFAEDELGKDPGYCAYSTGAGVPPDVLSLQVRRYPSAERAAGALRAVESVLDAEPVPGLGDGAYFGQGQLHVKKGNLQLTITIHAPHVANPYAAAQELARKALARL